MIVMFRVDGPAVGKARPRVTMHGTYTPKQTREYEAKLQEAYMEQCGDKRFPDGAPVALKVVVVKAPPKSASKKIREQMLSGGLLPVQKPDWDNFGKITDALNGIAWADDSQVVNGQVVKVYGEQPFMGIIISDAETFAHEAAGIRGMFSK